MEWEISQGKLEYHEDREEETLIEKAEDLAMEWEITQGKLEYYEDRGGKTLIITVVTRAFKILCQVNLNLQHAV